MTSAEQPRASPMYPSSSLPTGHLRPYAQQLRKRLSQGRPYAQQLRKRAGLAECCGQIRHQHGREFVEGRRSKFECWRISRRLNLGEFAAPIACDATVNPRQASAIESPRIGSMNGSDGHGSPPLR